MNDNDIIKALEICVNGGWCFRDNCPLARKEYGYGDEAYERCTGELMEQALGLLKRQQTEIETLRKNAHTLSYHCIAGRNEAITEFAVKLKERSDCSYVGDIGMVAYRVLGKDLDKLVKELTEG